MTTPTTPTSHDDDTITAEKAQTIGLGYADIQQRLERQIAHAVTSGDLDGLTEPIQNARRYDALVELWLTYSHLGATAAATAAGRMLYLAVQRSDIDAARLEAARSFLGDIHEQHTAHAQALRHITHGIA